LAAPPAGDPTPGRSAPADRLIPAVALLIALVAAFCYRDFLLLHKAFLFTDMGADTVNAQYPLLVHWADTLRAGHLPGWSFRMGLGQNLYPGSLGNPFNLILMALGRDAIPYALAYVEVAKLVLAGGLFTALLLRLGLAPLAVAVGGMLYAFSGFMVLGGTWYTFSTEGVYLALMLLAFERYRARGRWGLLVLAFALIGAGRPFNLFNNGLFLVVYATVRAWTAGDASPRAHLGLLARVTGLACVGAAVSGVFLLPALHEMLSSQRVGGVTGASERARLMAAPVLGTADAPELKTALLRGLANDLLGRGSDFRGPRQYLDAPLFYVGLPALLLAPQLFPRLAGRRRLAVLGLTALTAVPVLFPYVRHALWLFAADYYRITGFMLALVPLFLGLVALSRIVRDGRVHLPLLGGTLAVLLALPWLPLPPRGAVVDGTVRLWVSGLLLAHAVAIALLGRPRLARAGGAVLIALICVEAVAIATPAATARPVVTAADLGRKVGYNDPSADAAAWLRAHDPGVYRVEKTFASSPSDYRVYRNDALVQGYRGTSAYHRFNNPAYLRFLVAMDATDLLSRTHMRVVQGFAGRLWMHPFLGIRYLLAPTDDSATLAAWFAAGSPGTDTAALAAALYRPLRSFDGVTVWEDVHALPLAFTYDRFMDHRAFLALPRAVREKALYYAFVADPRDPEAVRGLTPFDPAAPDAPFPAALAARAKGGAEVTEPAPGVLVAKVRTEGPAMLAFTVPDDPGWSALVDDAPAPLRLVNFGFLGVALGPGDHTVELCYRPPARGWGAGLSVLGLLAVAALVAGPRFRRGERRRRGG
jgi:hypothetical protein